MSPRKKARRYASKKQVRWAFANKKSFARKWAHRGISDSGRKKWYRKLPRRSKGKKGKS